MTDPHATVLFVCTGNICRSAYGHHLLTQQLEQSVPGRYQVTSAGTQINPRLVVPPQITALQRASTLQSLAAHSPTQVSGRTVQKADLVLAATADHLRSVLGETPGALSRSFTMLEFGAAAQAVAEGTVPAWPGPESDSSTLPENLRSLARHLSRHRPTVRSSMDSIDLPDPYGREDAAYPAMAAALEPAVDRITDLLVDVARRS
ncbi:low molecular weight phosphatase family protein [Citricoccus sp. GCM10030269]|uniref:arsenate-mycothiol transferase ArsC n=1 Tax=Citricoccus sp. GCM10030269 TaxID=3273388 RepID=UPI00361BAF6B